MYERIVDLDRLLKHRSVFLLGPRQTGKSTLLRSRYPRAKYYDLLAADTFRELSANPEALRQQLSARDRLILIDEIQKLPSLLDEVQLLIEQDKTRRFVLTGSSARKLKRGGGNLLAGRAWNVHLHPLVSPELGFERIPDRLSKGSLPFMIDSPSPSEDLKAYVGNYLQEEIRAEGLTRSIENFSRFLQVAGLSNGEQLSFTSVGSDAQVPPRTVREFYQVLVDTLLGYMLEPYRSTKKRKAVSTSKFYFFDVGVANQLNQRTHIAPGTTEFGRALEHQVFLELRAYLDYQRLDVPLSYWRSLSQFEVDFLVGDDVAIEVKGKGRVAPSDCKGLLALGEDLRLKKKIIVCSEKSWRRTDEGIEVLPYDMFFRRLWEDDLV